MIKTGRVAREASEGGAQLGGDEISAGGACTGEDGAVVVNCTPLGQCGHCFLHAVSARIAVAFGVEDVSRAHVEIPLAKPSG